ncbi:MAG: ABC transporter ATP-binding protein [Candidatus Micrarchaeia archaeon]|jgi:energy-coupling factor transport system ATP-binding protein
MDALCLKNVSFRYAHGKAMALDRVSLALREGEFVGIIGPNGSGKTTLLCCCNGLAPKEIRGKFSGSVSLFGKDVARMGFPEISRQCSMVFQDPNDQIFNLTVEDEAAFGLLNAGMRREEALERAGKALSRVGLSGFIHHDPSELSSGQKQKVAIASALAAESRLILLDEPVSSLDWRSSCEIYSILDELVKEGKTVVLTEQDTGLLLEHASRVVVMDGGRVVADGPRDILLSGLVEKLGLRVPPIAKLAQDLGMRGSYAQVKAKLAALANAGRRKRA